MTSLKKISVLALLCLISSPVWSARVDFCKVKKSYDEKDPGISPKIIYEDCAGVAYLGSIGKDLAKAACWSGANDLLEGKCEIYNNADRKKDAAENLGDDAQEALPSELTE
ncbi:hypothetical protein IVG45_22245 [Methylomonas sp. LL1]|uniref:hypothetical protein n=1 Tax=Methylomonas sp. LL1 TaxID=2785785 RepID=UPI0018C39EC7|nr:hypothetical protein [Methylomonas sp. LL1]QPK63478.1 hypothetical protein IVG45_22245 [Methylomonas sp. LL1]